MRLRNVRNKKEIIENCNFLVKDPVKYRGSYQSLFTNSNPIHLEIGMGKGLFISEMARLNPHLNFIGLEKNEGILAKAIKQIGQCPPNLILVHYDARFISNIFNHEIDLIYLNFSDPWPKKKHEPRRLTSYHFLQEYNHLFCSNQVIVLKTDNADFFAYSLVSLSQNGYQLEAVSLDLEKSALANVKTEFEIKFQQKGFRINYLKAIKFL